MQASRRPFERLAGIDGQPAGHGLPHPINRELHGNDIAVGEGKSLLFKTRAKELV